MRVLSVCQPRPDGKFFGVHPKRLIPAAFSLAVVAAIAGSWMFAGAASALDLGPVSVPVTLPPPVAALVPTIGPVNVTTPPGTPQLGVSVSTSPTAGVAVGATLPPTIGPIPLLPGVPHSVQVAVGPGGIGVGVATRPVGTPSGGAGASGTTATPANGSTAGSPAATHTPALPAPAPDPASIGPGQPLPASATGRAPQGAAVSSPNAEAIPGAVSASLHRPASGGTWNLLRAATSAHTLWIALAVALLAARWAMNGFVRDARRRGRPGRPHVSSV